jgi:hypothetical protein
LDHKGYRETIKDLYSQIIIFQATYVCFLSDHNAVVRWMQDVVKWQGWDDMIKAIEQKNGALKSLDEHWRAKMQQDEWDCVKIQHRESIEKLDVLGQEMRRFRELVADARARQERSSLLLWLQTVLPGTYYDAAVAKRKKYATGDWLLKSTDFVRWETQANSFLWLTGKGRFMALEFPWRRITSLTI